MHRVIADDASNSRILITGGAGFIGSHLAQLLRSQNKRLLIIDDLSTGAKENIAPLLGDACELVQGSAGELLRQKPQLLDGVTQVYHLAAAVGVKLVVNQPLRMVRDNVDETALVLEAAAKRNIPALLASSSEVYGKNPSLPLSEDKDLLYGPTTSPRWSYALSKALDEHMALAHARQGKPVVIVRLFNTIGPRQIGHYGMVVPRFVSRAVAGEPLVVYGDGKQTRCFCDVRDVVGAMVRLLDDPSHHGQIFNVGSDHEISIGELADRVIALAGTTSEKQFISYEQAYDAGFEDMRRRVPALERICSAIGFSPKYSLDDTLRELIELAQHAQQQA